VPIVGFYTLVVAQVEYDARPKAAEGGSGLLKVAMPLNCLRATYSEAAEFDCIVSHTLAVPGSVC
jgi:hypothetical protein